MILNRKGKKFWIIFCHCWMCRWSPCMWLYIFLMNENLSMWACEHKLLWRPQALSFFKSWVGFVSFSIIFTVCVYVCVHLCRWVHVCHDGYQGQRSTVAFVLSCHLHMGPRTWTQIAGLHSKHFYLLNYISNFLATYIFQLFYPDLCILLCLFWSFVSLFSGRVSQ